MSGLVLGSLLPLYWVWACIVAYFHYRSGLVLGSLLPLYKWACSFIVAPIAIIKVGFYWGLCLQLCVSQKCTAISALDYIQPCPLGSNGQTCADAGVNLYLFIPPFMYLNFLLILDLQMCNNLNMCSCNVGFTGNSCEQRLRTSSGISGGMSVLYMRLIKFGVHDNGVLIISQDL